MKEIEGYTLFVPSEHQTNKQLYRVKSVFRYYLNKNTGVKVEWYAGIVMDNVRLDDIMAHIEKSGISF